MTAPDGTWSNLDRILGLLRRDRIDDALALIAAELVDATWAYRYSLLLTRGRVYTALGEPDLANADLDAALELVSDAQERAQVLLARAEARLIGNRIAEAEADLTLLTNLVDSGYSNAVARHMLGRIARERGELVRAIELLSEARAAAFDDPDLYSEVTLDLAVALRSAGEPLQALALLEELAGHDDPAWQSRVLAQVGTTQAFIGRHDLAIAAYERALRLTSEPTDRARLRYNRAVALREIGDRAAAHEELASITFDDVGEDIVAFDTLLLRGILGRESGELQVALDDLRRALELAPDEDRQGKARLEIGATLAATGLFGLAVDELSAALELCQDPDDRAVALRYRGVARHEMGLTGLALDDFTRAVALTADPDDRARGELTRAALLVDAGRLDEAYEALDRSLASAVEPAVLAQLRFQRGSLAIERGDFDIGLSDLERAATYARESGDTAFETQIALNRGVALNATGALDEAADAFRRAADLAGRGELAYLALMNLARTLVSDNRPDDAFAAYERAAPAAEDDRDARAEAFLARGQAAVRWGRYVQADADFTRVLALQPSDPVQAQARYARGMTRSLLGQLERAREDLTVTIETARDRDHRAQALVDRGLVALAAGDFAGAETDLRAAAESFRHRAERAMAHAHLAIVHAQRGDCAAAATAARDALALDREGRARELLRTDVRLAACWERADWPAEQSEP
jgi:tetratricopeptide (TPR) repeat protein